jgi:predicted  nucleic acid-binding Zn-ribbon protein
MSRLDPLLDIQELDVAAGRAREHSANLPERAAIPLLHAALSDVDQRLTSAESERSQIQSEEEILATEVSQIARDIESAEVERYSGKRLNQDEAAAHNESQQLLRDRKAAIEEREMELLEALEDVEARIDADRGARAGHLAEGERVNEAIRKAEAEVASELEALERDRSKLTSQIPAPLLGSYDRVRAQPRAGGRGAARLDDGRCGACRIKLPSHEKTKMMALPENALIQCPQCRRVLVR